MNNVLKKIEVLLENTVLELEEAAGKQALRRGGNRQHTQTMKQGGYTMPPQGGGNADVAIASTLGLGGLAALYSTLLNGGETSPEEIQQAMAEAQPEPDQGLLAGMGDLSDTQKMAMGGAAGAAGIGGTAAIINKLRKMNK
jgi:hypothetical protein